MLAIVDYRNLPVQCVRYGVYGKLHHVDDNGCVVTVQLDYPVCGHKNMLWQCHPSFLEIGINEKDHEGEY